MTPPPPLPVPCELKMATVAVDGYCPNCAERGCCHYTAARLRSEQAQELERLRAEIERLKAEKENDGWYRGWKVAVQERNEAWVERDKLKAQLAALIATWRESAAWEQADMGNTQYASALDQCADELAALLVAFPSEKSNHAYRKTEKNP